MYLIKRLIDFIIFLWCKSFNNLSQVKTYRYRCYSKTFLGVVKKMSMLVFYIMRFLTWEKRVTDYFQKLRISSVDYLNNPLHNDQ